VDCFAQAFDVGLEDEVFLAFWSLDAKQIEQGDWVVASHLLEVEHGLAEVAV
jgi:hypothetical protein